MTVYPDWIKVSCPVCNARVNEPCTAVLNLPKGTTLRYPHHGRFIAYEQTQTNTSKDEKIRDSREVLSSDTIGDRTKPNRTTRG